jgi:cytochrome b561
LKLKLSFSFRNESLTGAFMALSLRNSKRRYGTVAIILHWLIAIAIVAQLWLGFFMERLAEGSFQRFEALQRHKSLGLTILILSVARLVWRLANPTPRADPGLAPIERRLAGLAHFGLYFLIIAVPLTGWATVSASPLGLPIQLYGVIEWPHLPFFGAVGEGQAMEDLMHAIHKGLVLALIGLALIHILAALRHQFLLKNAVLGRMIPWLGGGAKTDESE